ncbi:MAG: T9SS type B sorting domain-containing protein, partial [Flavipsychrobacter sp.]
ATNTTTCTSNDGTISLNGMQNSTSYTVLYSKNGVSASTTIVSNPSGGVLVIKNLSPGIYDSIRVQYSGCTSNMVGPITISNPTQPATPAISNNSPICHNTALNFTGSDATAPVTWTWSGPNSFSSSVANPTISNAIFADSGLYYAYVTDTNGCQSAVVTSRVSFMPTPDDPTGSSNAPICEGATLNLTASSSTSGVTYMWTGPAFPTGDTAQNPSIPNVTMADAGDYVVYAILNGCKSINPLTLNVYVKWIPGVPTVTTNAPVCSDKGYQGNNTLTLTAGDTTSGVTYKWTGPNSFSASSTSKKQSRTNPPMADTGWYYVYATYKGCNSALDSVHVTLKQTPAPPTLLPSLNLYCQYDGTSPLKVSGTGTINWYTVSSGGTALSGAPTPDATVPAINIWYVTQTINGCESPYAMDTALVKAKPLAPVASGTPYVYCQGDNSKPLAVIGVKLLWYTTATGGVGSPVTPTPSTNTPGTYDYYVSQTVNGCESDRTHITVTIKPKPNKPSVSAVTYCQNDPAIPLSAGGVNLLWYNVSSGGVGIPTAPTPVTSYPDTSYYYVTQTTNGCESDRAEVPVYVYYKPNAVIVASTTYVCQHDTMSFSYYGNGTSDAAYNWTMPKGASIVGGIGQGPIVARFDSAGKYKVLLQVDNHGCKSPLTSAMVDVRESPIVPVVLQKEACQGDIVNVSIGNPNETIDNYSWDFGGATVVYGASGAGPYGIRFDNQGLYVVKLIAVTSACPSLPILDSIYIHPQADAHIMSVSNSTVCSGDSVHFTAESYNPSYLYQWLPATYFENNTNMGDVYGLVQTSGYVKLSVTTEYGCTSTDSILIHAEPCCDVYFPNAFTPNGDGKNDIFRPLSNGRQQVKNFRVANRWGQIMFETVDQHTGWDGKFGGVPQDMGSYYYYIEYECANGKTYTKKGEVVLVR